MKRLVLITLFILTIFVLTFNLKTTVIYASEARSDTVSGDVFLGGDFIELGISRYGSFGTDANKPAAFFGTGARSNIGMSSDLDGFGVGTDWRMDFFLPGTQEERWGVGYKISGSPTTAANAKRNGNLIGIADNIVTNESSGNLLKAISIGTLNSNLQVTQVISFNKSDKFFKNVVTLENVSVNTDLDEVRFMRSFDPDNTVDKGGSYTTRNSIVFTHQAGDGKTVVQADTSASDSDPVYIGTGGADGGTRSPIFFYSSDPRAKVNYHSSLVPGNVYTPALFDSTNPKGSAENRDGAISITFDVGTLGPGESETLIYYTSLDERDFSEVEEEIQQDEAENAPSISNKTVVATSITATVSWTTDVNASSQVEYGLTPAYGFETNESNTSPRVQTHQVLMQNLKSCARYFYRVKSKNSSNQVTTSEQGQFATTGCTINEIDSGVEEDITTSGGSLSTTTNTGNVSLVIPNNFHTEPASFQINKLVFSGVTSPDNKSLLPGNLFELIAVSESDEKITSFDESVTFIVEYDEDITENFVEETLDLYKYISGEWVAQSCQLDVAANTLTCTLGGFSTYGVFGQQHTSGENNEETSEQNTTNKTFHKDKRCHYETPPEITWVKFVQQTKEGKKGMYVTWTQYSATRVNIKIDDGTGTFPWKISKTINDGNEFLENVEPWQKIMIKPFNECKEGKYSLPFSLLNNPGGWYNLP